MPDVLMEYYSVSAKEQQRIQAEVDQVAMQHYNAILQEVGLATSM